MFNGQPRLQVHAPLSGIFIINKLVSIKESQILGYNSALLLYPEARSPYLVTGPPYIPPYPATTSPVLNLRVHLGSILLYSSFEIHVPTNLIVIIQYSTVDI